MSKPLLFLLLLTLPLQLLAGDETVKRVKNLKAFLAQLEKETPETVVDLPHTDLRLLSKPDYGMESVKPVGVGIPTSFLPIVEDCTQNEKWKNIKC